MSLHRLYAAVLGSGLLALGGCSDPISEVKFENWEPELAAPVLNTSFTLRDALADTPFSAHLSEDSTSALSIRVREQLFDIAPAESLEIEDVVVPLLDTATRVTLAEAGAQPGVSRLDLVGGAVGYRFSNDQEVAVTVEVVCGNLTADGAAYVQTLQVPAFDSVTYERGAGGFMLSFDDAGTVAIDYRATRSDDGRAVRLPFGAFALTDLAFDYAEGTLEELRVDLGRDSVALDVLDAFEPGTIELLAPTATLTVDNSAGVPVRIATPEAYVVGRDGERAGITSPLATGVDVAFPSAAEGLATKTTRLEFANETSNFVELINAFPTQLAMSLAAAANPDGVDEDYFLHRDARITGRLDVDIPLDVRFNGFELTEDFVFDGSTIAEAVEATFYLSVENGFGLDASTQVYFFDEAGAAIDSLFAGDLERVLVAADTDEAGATVTPTTQRTEVVVPAERIDALARTRSATVRLRLTSPDAPTGSTRLYYDARIGVRLGARVTTRPF